MSGAADAALHLVEEEQQIVLIAKRAQAAEEFGRADVNAAFALNRLDEDRGRLVVDECGERFEIIEFAEHKTRYERTKSLLDFFLRSGAHAAVGAAVEGAFGADDFRAFTLFAALGDAVEPREFDQGFVGLGAAVTEKNAARAGVADETLRELALIGMTEKIADVDERGGLGLHGGDPTRVAMAKGIDRDAGGEIQVAAASIVPDVGAFAANQVHGRTAVVFHHIRIVESGGVGGRNGSGRIHGGGTNKDRSGGAGKSARGRCA